MFLLVCTYFYSLYDLPAPCVMFDFLFLNALEYYIPEVYIFWNINILIITYILSNKESRGGKMTHIAMLNQTPAKKIWKSVISYQFFCYFATSN